MSLPVHIEDLGLSFAGVRALDGVSLDVPAGALVAVIGPNGAGKTSLFNCISGVYRPERGRICLGERDITPLSCHRVAALGVARMFQNLALFENLTVLENVLVGRHHLVRSRLWQHILWTRATRDEEVAHRRRAEEIIEFLHLETYRRIPVHILPYGVRKRVELGRALAMEPALLLLDEPTAGLNQEETEDMARYILDIKEELGITQILIEHELRFVLDLAENVAVLDFGKKIAEGAPAEIREHPDVIAAYIGHEHGSESEATADTAPRVAGKARAASPAAEDNQAGAGEGHDAEMAVNEMAEAEMSAADTPAGGMALVEMPAAEPGTEAFERTLPGQLVLRSQETPDAVALRVKELGIWREISWREYAAAVRATARMLWELGVRPGDHVAIISDNRPEWLFADLAAQSLGARSVGIYQTNPAEDVAYVLNDSRAMILFCEDQEQVDKAVAIAEKTPTVRQVVVFDARGTRDIDDSRLMRWDDFLARGMALADATAPDDWFVRCVAALDANAPAMVIYTSGTTGPPKGAMISSENVVPVTRAFVDAMGITSADSMLSYLPLCHVAEKIFSIFLPLLAGAVVHFGESIETVQSDLREVSPTIFLGVPRIWEKMHASIQIKMQDSSWLKRTLFARLARPGATQTASSPGRGVLRGMGKRISDLLIYRPLQERLGLRRCWLPISGAAPISPDILSWFHGVGIPIVEGYGQTECAGVSHIGQPGAMRLGTVGPAVPLVECRLAEDGEVLVRGPNVFCGYFNRPEATAETIDSQGWLHTGDIGTLDKDGNLSITGRKKEIIITSGGKNLSPEKIENALKTSPYIKEAVAVGDNRKFISALVQIDYDRVGDWAMRRGIAYTSYGDLAGKKQVVDLIAAEIDRANDLLARVETVRAFRILPKELNQDDGELTATQKVRRRAIHDAFADLIESIYKPSLIKAGSRAEPGSVAANKGQRA